MYQLLSTPNRQTLVDYLGFPTPAGPLSPDPSFAAGAPTSPCDPTSLGRLGPKSLELFFAGQQVADSSLEFLVCYILYVLAKHGCCRLPSVVCLLLFVYCSTASNFGFQVEMDYAITCLKLLPTLTTSISCSILNYLPLVVVVIFDVFYIFNVGKLPIF